MKEANPVDFAGTVDGKQDEIGRRLRRVERQEWILWGTAVTITLLLTVGIVSFLLPLLRTTETGDSLLSLQSELIGLLAIVLLFDLYTIYQQLQIHRIRRQLSESQQVFR